MRHGWKILRAPGRFPSAVGSNCAQLHHEQPNKFDEHTFHDYMLKVHRLRTMGYKTIVPSFEYE